MKFSTRSFLVGALSILTFATTTTAIEVGERISPDIDLHYGFPPEEINVADRLKGKKVILVGLPGAYTPTWSNVQVPGYLSNIKALRNLGIYEVIIYCVNDGAVMEAWEKDQEVPEESLVNFMGDPYGYVTEALDMKLTHSGPESVGLVGRCKRFVVYFEDGVARLVRIAESDEDPAGDEFPDVTLAENIISDIKALDGGEL